MDTEKNLALLFGAAKKPEDERFKRLTIVIDKAGKIVKIDKEVNASTHGSDLVGFFKTPVTPKK